MVTPFVGSLMDALERPEAQTRWEVLDALTALVDEHAEEVAPAFEAAETALFDEDSAPVRLAGFVFLCRFGATSEERSDQVWPLLDEAIQCYHGDPEYRDMLRRSPGLRAGRRFRGHQGGSGGAPEVRRRERRELRQELLGARLFKLANRFLRSLRESFDAAPAASRGRSRSFGT